MEFTYQDQKYGKKTGFVMNIKEKNMAARRKSNNFLVQGSILAVASIIVRVIGLIYRIPMTRIVGDEAMGSYTIAFEVYNIALILSSYGLPIAVSKLIASRVVIKEYRNSHRIFVCSLIFAVIVGLVASILLFIGADYFAGVLNDDQYAILPLKILAPTIFVFSIMGVLRGFFQGKNTMIPTAVSQVLEQVVNAVVSLAAAYYLIRSFSALDSVTSYGAAGGTLGTLVGATVSLLFLLFVYIIYRPILKKQIRNDRADYQDSFKTIFKLIVLTISPIILCQTIYHINGILDNGLFMNIMKMKEVTGFDKAIFGPVADNSLYTEEMRRTLIGIYGNKYRTLVYLPVAIAASFGAAIVTSITAAKTRGMDAVIRNKAHAAIKFNMIIAIPSAVGMGVLAYPIMTMLFPASHQLDANLLKLGAVSIVFYSLSTVSTAILQGVGKLRIPVINSAISLAIHIPLIYVLLQYTPLSTYSLVIGNVSFALVVCILNWISVEKHLEYRQEILKTFIIPTVSAGLMGVAAYFTYLGLQYLTGSNTLSTIMSVLIAVILYLLLLVFMKGVDEEELLHLPRGGKVVRLLQKLHLL